MLRAFITHARLPGLRPRRRGSSISIHESCGGNRRGLAEDVRDGRRTVAGDVLNLVEFSIQTHRFRWMLRATRTSSDGETWRSSSLTGVDRGAWCCWLMRSFTCRHSVPDHHRSDTGEDVLVAHQVEALGVQLAPSPRLPPLTPVGEGFVPSRLEVGNRALARLQLGYRCHWTFCRCSLVRRAARAKRSSGLLCSALAPQDFKNSYYLSIGSSIFHWAHSAESPDRQEQPPEVLS